MPKLSIIILSYNTLAVTKKCLDSLSKSLSEHPIDHEIIVVDNASTDGSRDMLRKQKCLVVQNKKNVGFSSGNNQGFKRSSGEYLLFLNSDTIIQNVNFPELISFAGGRKDIGVVTVKVLLPSGRIDPASHRGFPTLWRSLTYFSKLEKIFGSIPVINRLFGGYHLTYLNLNSVHEIDSPTGAFYLVKRSIFEQVGGFDEKFFMYGEDLDLSYRIKALGFKVLYYPGFSILHEKYTSGLKTEDRAIRSKIKRHFYEAMGLFYKKHYSQSYPAIINKSVFLLLNWKLNNK